MASGVLSSHFPSRHSPPPPVGCCHAVSATIPTFSWLPENYGILHDASWCPKTRHCGGAVVVFCLDTLRFQIYPVAIPPRVDNAYTAELYTAWVALSARGPSADPTFVFRSSWWHFADCKGYITAQEGRREPGDSLQGDLIRECRALADSQPPPRHLYSHITGTWLHARLDQVDAAAGRSADSCPATVGWLSPLQEPRICFSHAGLQVHDALPHARRALLVSHHAYAKSPPPQRNPALGQYTIAVSHGLLSWGDRLIVTGLRLSLPPPPPRDTPCPLCLLPDPGDHVLPTRPSPPRPLPSVARGPALPEVSRLAPLHAHCLGVLILWGNKPFLLAVAGSPAHETLLTYTVGRIGAIAASRCPSAPGVTSCDHALPPLRHHTHHRPPTQTTCGTRPTSR